MPRAQVSIGRLSLRTRLLMAVGVVALLALVLADVTVYASLKSYLYRQADATVQVSLESVQAAATHPSSPDLPVLPVEFNEEKEILVSSNLLRAW